MLKCKTESMTKPATQITWTRNSLPYSDDLHDKIQEDDERHVFSSESTLHLTVRLEDQGCEFKCKARHVGLQEDMEVADDVDISVLVPPAKPEISGFVQGRDILHAGDRLSLSCTARGGNPLASVVWFRDSERVDDTSAVTAVDGGVATANTYSLLVKPEDNRRVFRCEASNVITSLSSELRLDVHFPPVNIKINGPSVGKINDVLRYQCIIGPSNPLPKHVTWIINGLPQKDGIYPVESWQEEVSFGFMTRTNITVLLSESIRTISCSASSSLLNGDLTTIEASIDVHVLCESSFPHLTLLPHAFPPSAPLFSLRAASSRGLRYPQVSNYDRSLIAFLSLYLTGNSPSGRAQHNRL